MRYLLCTLLFAAPVWAQDAAAPEGDKPKDAPKAAEPKKEIDSAALTATRLRDKVRTMRRDVLGGGPAVERSEKEALKFYRRKINELARQAEELRTKSAMKQAEYDLALETTLNAEDEDERAEAAREAGKLRTEISELDAEVGALERQSDMLGRGVAAIQKRIQRRKRLVSRFDDPGILEELPYLADELLDFEEESAAAGDPFLDEGFIADLLARDPEGARALLFKMDPVGYWKRFPLTPPKAALRKALKFPAPDLPGQR
ncbi:MAG: hypothetical protein ACYTGN_13220 [Planctomycetota bacterium]|jgi:prefoldin subunit 5